MPDWHILYEAVVGETNPSVFERLVFETEDAIWRRLRDLSKNPDGPLELNAISDAVEVILRLKVERLGWPNPAGSARSFPATRYAHTFLFRCPECNMPIAISRIRPERNLETIESRKIDLKCAYCNESSAMPAPMAKAHWVTNWA